MVTAVFTLRPHRFFVHLLTAVGRMSLLVLLLLLMLLLLPLILVVVFNGHSFR